jgi:hypothetical protein
MAIPVGIYNPNAVCFHRNRHWSFVYNLDNLDAGDCVMSKALSRRLFMSVASFRFPAFSYRICGGHIRTVTGFSSTSVFSCQCHSTNALCSSLS